MTIPRPHFQKIAVLLLGVGSLLGAFSAVAGATASASQPTVSTGPVSATTATAATVTGSINPNGAATSWYVEYGTTTGYGAKTAALNLASGTTTDSVSTTISGLATLTTYHYALVATNSAGTATGSDGIFTTATTPLATTGVVTEVSNDSLRLSGIVTPNGRATSFYFQYGTTTSYGTQTQKESAGSSSSAVSVSTLVANLMPTTLYHFRLVAVNSAGHSFGDDESAATSADVSLQADQSIITFGQSVVISGVAASHTAGQTVAIQSEPAEASQYTGLGTTTTTAGGNWSFTVRPSLRTSYKAAVAGGASPAIAISVRPAVTFSLQGGNRFFVTITASMSFAGHVAQVQRLTSGSWVLVRHFALGRGGRATIMTSVLPKGRSSYRVAIGTSVISPDQAGPGYLAGISQGISLSNS